MISASVDILAIVTNVLALTFMLADSALQPQFGMAA